MVKQIKRLQMGKNGLTDEFISQVKSVFINEKKLIKIDVLRSACRDKEELKKIAEKLVESLGKNYKYKIIGYVITVLKFRKEVRE